MPSNTDNRRQMRSTARFYAVQALFQMEAADQSYESVCQEFLDHRFGAEIEGDLYSDADGDLFQSLVSDAVNYQARIDKLTDSALVEKWPINRIDPTIRALFRAAGAELIQSGTPVKVVISEFVDIAKAFFPDGREPKFVNAVLDHMARDIRPDEFVQR